jgi:hypothetical protein
LSVVVDGKPHVIWVVGWKQPLEERFEFWIVKFRMQFFNAHILSHFPKHNLEEGSRSSGGCLTGNLYNLKDLPIECFGVEQVPKEFGEVPNLVGFMLEDSMVVFHECFDEVLFKHIFQFTESLCEQSKELLVDAFHHAAFDDHIAELVFMALGDTHLYYLVGALFEVHRRLQG